MALHPHVLTSSHLVSGLYQDRDSPFPMTTALLMTVEHSNLRETTPLIIYQCGQ